MPSSVAYGKSEIKKWFESRNDIKVILDIGCGSGTYPMLLGVQKYNWRGVEIWAPYVEQFKLKTLYQILYIGDFVWMSPKIYKWVDCVIMGDVIEHNPNKTLVLETIKLILDKVPHLVLSVPLSDSEPYEGREHYGNPFEKHVSYWKSSELTKITNWEVASVKTDIGIFIR
jgi:predicted TPR repeat methyltransferase